MRKKPKIHSIEKQRCSCGGACNHVPFLADSDSESESVDCESYEEEKEEFFQLTATGASFDEDHRDDNPTILQPFPRNAEPIPDTTSTPIRTTRKSKPKEQMENQK
ncbi:uncharacterized protein [Montipora foliosa]|uniref:uncharacterized protein n=1 Tax=Montipora foliosa TaxID=591990 RepID=UPI0035F18A8B